MIEELLGQLLAFSGVLDQKLAAIATRFELPLQAVRDVCLLHRKLNTLNAYWERWNQLHSQLSAKFYDVMEAVDEALKTTPRASSMVETSTHGCAITSFCGAASVTTI